MKTISPLRSLAVAAALTLTASALAGVAAPARAQGVDFAKAEITTVKLTDSLYVLVAGPAQGNILASVGPDGILIVDTMYPQMHDKIVAALKAISPQPIRYVVNTHLHGDHTGGNAAMARLGAVIISQDNMRKRMAEGPNPSPAAALPTMTYSDTLTLHFNGDDILIFHPLKAHTDGDSIIYFRKADVMQVGDVPASLRYPNIGVEAGGTVDGMIAAGRQVMQVANPKTKIVSGHLGPVIGFREIEQQIVMFEAVRDRVTAQIKAGKSEAEVVASKPTKDFDQGRLGGAITPDRFVSLVYQDLSKPK